MAEKNRDAFMVDEGDAVKNTYLTFSVEEENYAANIAHVTEIVGMQKISEVPDVPEFIKGVINLRGKVIPVMDVRTRFGLPWREYNDRTTIIVLELEGVPAGLAVDRVNEVIEIPEEDVDRPPSWHGSGKPGVIRGLGKHDDGVSIILDVERLLNSRESFLELPGEAPATADA